MSNKTIDEVTPDTNVTGVEKLPVSDGGTPKSMTVEQVKDFVLTKINALEAATDIAVASDGVFIKKDGAMKPVGASVLASAVVSFAFGSESAASLAGTDVVVIAKSGVAKTTTLATLAQYVKDAMALGTVDFGDYTFDGNPNDTTQFLIADGEETATKKTGMTFVANALVSVISGYIPSSQTALDADDDYLVAVNDNGTDLTLKRVKLSASGIGAGNVTGPSTNTANKIPQWDGANSKTLKDGLTLVNSVSSTSSGTEVPTAAATYSAVAAKVTAPATNSANKIPAWNGTANSKTLVDGYGVDDVDISGDVSVLPTSRAVHHYVSQQIADMVNKSGDVTSTHIPTWANSSVINDSGKRFLNGSDSSGMNPGLTPERDDELVPTKRAVNGRIDSVRNIISEVYVRDNIHLNPVPSPTTRGKMVLLRDARNSVGDKTYLLVCALHHFTGESASRLVWFSVELPSIYQEIEED